MGALGREMGSLWRASRPLTAVGFGMLVVFGLSLVGLIVDARLVGGALVWLKPAKFAISTAIFMITLAWMLSHLEGWPRLKRIAGGTTATLLTVEVALIDLQAARGVNSHFNVATAFDALVFAVMAIAIVVQSAMSVALTVAFFRQRFTDPALGWAIRFGLLISVIGAMTGGLMTRPTDEQLTVARTTHRMTVVGAHTVGVPDGAPGMPGTGWSLEHGDLRVPHFLGLHALQILPLLAWLLRGAGSAVKRRRAVLAAAASYGALFGILLAQALTGQSVLAPEGPIRVALLAWSVVTALGLTFILSSGRTAADTTSVNVMVS